MVIDHSQQYQHLEKALDWLEIGLKGVQDPITKQDLQNRIDNLRKKINEKREEK